jgi:hypothetical protein
MEHLVVPITVAISLLQLSTASAIPALDKRATAPPMLRVPLSHRSLWLEPSAPGTILRSRLLDDFSFFSIVLLHVKAAYQLLFRTRDSI